MSPRAAQLPGVVQDATLMEPGDPASDSSLEVRGPSAKIGMEGVTTGGSWLENEVCKHLASIDRNLARLSAQIDDALGRQRGQGTLLASSSAVPCEDSQPTPTLDSPDDLAREPVRLNLPPPIAKSAGLKFSQTPMALPPCPHRNSIASVGNDDQRLAPQASPRMIGATSSGILSWVRSSPSQSKRDSLETLSTARAFAGYMLPWMFQRQRSERAQRIWNLLDDPESGPCALIMARILKGLILCSIVVSLLQTVPFDVPPHAVMGAALETTFDVIFTLELLVRLLVCPNRTKFLQSKYTCIDMLASSALILRAAVGFVLPPAGDETAVSIILLCILPIVRAFKLLRLFATFRILLDAFKATLEALPVLLYTMFIITLVAASLIYIAEPRDNISSLPMAIWLSIVTMTTVGYGDVTPTNGPGYVVVSCLVVLGALFMAMPLGIIGNAFNESWSSRDTVLLMSRVRNTLQKWGYTPQDIQVLFHAMDVNGNGQLELEEFTCLVREMKLGLSDDRVLKLFQSIDVDSSGFIDAPEFCRCAFPNLPDEVGALPKIRPVTRSCYGVKRQQRSTLRIRETTASRVVA